MLCKYNELFGKVGKGVHSIRIFNIAIIDVLLTILGAYLIHLYIPNSEFLMILLIAFSSGIILHRLFCVKTTIDNFLFG
jgi:hypothetical protein